MSDAQETTEAPLVRMDEFMIELMGQNARDAAWGFQQTSQHWQERAERAEAALMRIRDTVHAMFEGPFQPSQRAILGALYPDMED